MNDSSYAKLGAAFVLIYLSDDGGKMRTLGLRRLVDAQYENPLIDLTSRYFRMVEQDRGVDAEEAGRLLRDLCRSIDLSAASQSSIEGALLRISAESFPYSIRTNTPWERLALETVGRRIGESIERTLARDENASIKDQGIGAIRSLVEKVPFRRRTYDAK